MENFLRNIPFDKNNTLLHPPSDGKYETLQNIYNEVSESKTSKYCERFLKQFDEWTAAFKKTFNEFNGETFVRLLKEISDTYSAYEFPMGKAEAGEIADQVAAREWWEETTTNLKDYSGKRAIIRNGRRGTRVTVVYDVDQYVVPNYGDYIKNVHLNMAKDKEKVNFSFTVREADSIFWEKNLDVEKFGFPTTELFLKQIEQKKGVAVDDTMTVNGVVIRNFHKGNFMLQRSDRANYALKGVLQELHASRELESKIPNLRFLL